MVNMQDVKRLEDAIKDVFNILDGMDDETYEAIDDFSETSDHGRYQDMADWLQWIYSNTRGGRF